MKFGVVLPSYWADYGSFTPPAALLEVARAADALGFDSLWSCDHLIGPENNPGSGQCLEPLIVMSSLVHLFPRLRFGTGVLVLPQRSAIVAAKQAATLDVLSGGRFILGIGAGWQEAEFRQVGADFEQRGAHTDEGIRLMRALWAENPVTFQGQFYNLSNAHFFPKPVAKPAGPQIWIGGSSDSAVRRAARFGDAWMPWWGEWAKFNADLGQFRAQVQRLRDWSAEYGSRQPLAVVNVPLLAAAGKGQTDRPAPAQVLDTLAQYREAGMQYVICNILADTIPGYLEQMQLVKDQLMPAFADGN